MLDEWFEARAPGSGSWLQARNQPVDLTKDTKKDSKSDGEKQGPVDGDKDEKVDKNPPPPGDPPGDPHGGPKKDKPRGPGKCFKKKRKKIKGT